MREGQVRRWVQATGFALLAGLAVACGNPLARMKADLRADAHGFVISLEYVAHEAEG